MDTHLKIKIYTNNTLIHFNLVIDNKLKYLKNSIYLYYVKMGPNVFSKPSGLYFNNQRIMHIFLVKYHLFN